MSLFYQYIRNISKIGLIFKYKKTINKASFNSEIISIPLSRI